MNQAWKWLKVSVLLQNSRRRFNCLTAAGMERSMYPKSVTHYAPSVKIQPNRTWRNSLININRTSASVSRYFYQSTRRSASLVPPTQQMILSRACVTSTKMETASYHPRSCDTFWRRWVCIKLSWEDIRVQNFYCAYRCRWEAQRRGSGNVTGGSWRFTG